MRGRKCNTPQIEEELENHLGTEYLVHLNKRKNFHLETDKEYNDNYSSPKDKELS